MIYAHEFAIEHIERQLMSAFPSMARGPKCKLWNAGVRAKLVSTQACNAARKYYNEKGIWRDKHEPTI